MQLGYGWAAAIAAAVSWWLLWTSSSGRPLSLSGSNAIVTGASQGIGHSLVFELAKCGAANIVVASRSEDRLRALAASIEHDFKGQTRVHVVVSDLSTQESADALIQKSLTLLDQKLDVLILNHITSSRFGPWLARSDQSFVPAMFAVNTFSYIWAATAAAEALGRTGGRIGVVSSLAGHVGTPKTAIYSATKHALHGFFNAFRAELAYAAPEFQRISVTLCAIGATETPGAAEVKDQISSLVSWDSPDWAAEAIVRGVGARKREIFHPFHVVYPAVLLHQFLPSLFDRILVFTHTSSA